MEMKVRIATLGGAISALLALAVAPAMAATQTWAYASGQLRATATATCPAGQFLMGGGYQASEFAKVSTSSPEWDSQSWTVTAVNSKPGSGDINIGAVAICV